MVSTTNKQTHCPNSFPSTISTRYLKHLWPLKHWISIHYCPVTLLHEGWIKHRWGIKRVENDVIRLSSDLFNLCHKGSVTANRHFSSNIKQKNMEPPLDWLFFFFVKSCCCLIVTSNNVRLIWSILWFSWAQNQFPFVFDDIYSKVSPPAITRWNISHLEMSVSHGSPKYYALDLYYMTMTPRNTTRDSTPSCGFQRFPPLNLKPNTCRGGGVNRVLEAACLQRNADVMMWLYCIVHQSWYSDLKVYCMATNTTLRFWRPTSLGSSSIWKE